MKLAIVVLAILGTALCRNVQKSSLKVQLKSGDCLPEDKYDTEIGEVTTEDGYILNLVHIRSKAYQQKQDRKPVLLVPGMLSTFEDFIAGDSEGLAQYLADQHYDVYLANLRGTRDSRHTTLNPKSDAAFWRFSAHEIGVKDLPAIIDAVLEDTKQSQLTYIGHRQGSTYYYILASEKPEYNNKIDQMISLGPVAFMEHSKNLVLNKIVSNMRSKPWILKNVGLDVFTPSQELLQDAETQCVSQSSQGVYEKTCSNPYFLINGAGSTKMNQTTVNLLLPYIPTQTSVRQVMHFTQMHKSGRFQQLDINYENQQQQKEYDLSKVTSRVAIIYAPNDDWSQVEDVQTLINKLPSVSLKQKVDSIDNNMDLLFSKNVRQNVFPLITSAISMRN